MPKKNSKNESWTFVIFLAVILVTILFTIYSMNGKSKSMYTLEFPGRYRTTIAPHPGSYGWKYGDTLNQCNFNYSNCMKGCEIYPRIGCPGECLEQKEYCQEYSS